MVNRSLDEFVDRTEPASDDDSPPESDRAEPDGTDTTPAIETGVEDGQTGRDGSTPTGAPSEPDAERGDVEPIESTYVWSPDGGSCAACGDPVEERWRDGPDLVCADCKEW